MAEPRSRIRLRREDWIDAALRALADDGPAGIAVERLAARLGTTKGSFYWHFRNREELVDEALRSWERRDTDATVSELTGVEDPVERLRIATAMAIGYDEADRPDVRLLPSASDPLVGDVVRRVQQKRLEFLAQIFRDAGFTPSESRLRSRLAYSLALGWHHQQLVEGAAEEAAADREAYERRAVAMLMARS